MTTCTVCRVPMAGHPDDDACCIWCERNFAGDPLRHPPRAQRHPLPWWQRERLPLAANRDGLRALTFVQGPWIWHEEDGIVERGDAQ
jgi:hypothetical protein